MRRRYNPMDAEARAWWENRMADIAEQRALALTIDCPFCKAPIGRECRTVTTNKRPPYGYHPARGRAALVVP